MASLESAENHKLSNKISIDKHRHLLVLIGLFAGLSLLLFSILLYFAIVRPNKNDSVCLTRDCTLTASTLVSAMDPSYDPCEDFFKFTCANFIRKTPVPTDKIQVTSFEQYLGTFQLQLKNLIEDYNPYGEPDVVYRLLETYHLCLNTSEDKNKELNAFKEFIVDVFDGWPMATGSQWKFRFNNLTDYFANIYRYGFYPHIFYVVLNYTSWDADTMEHITKPGLHVIFDYIEVSTLFNNDDEEADTEVGESYDERKTLEIQKAKQKVIMELMKPFGNPTPFAVTRAINQMKEFVSFTNELLKKIGKSDNFTELNIRDMNEQSDLDWLKIFTSKYPNEAFSLDTKVQVRNAKMLLELPKIFEKYPVKVFIDLLIANLMTKNNLLDFTTPNIVKAVNEYEELLRENYFPPKRWEFCLEKIREHYPMALTRMFINKFVDKNGKTIVDEMIQMIQEAYKQRILDSDWLDESTKERAVRKAEAIERFVAYPASIFDDKILEELYKYIPTVRSSWLWHILDLRENRSNRNFYGEDEILIELYKWQVDPLLLNAFYNHQQNSIWFPSGILQLPFFDENRLASVNFGMIGAVIGHEIGHAFDNMGKNFNEKGEEEMWWTNNTAEEFETRSQCFINQYEKYCPEDLQGGVNDTVICVNGDWTLGENLADSTGLSAAYDAYQMWIRKNGNEPRLPGLEMYSPEQVLFISFGYIYCENTPPDVWLERYKYDSHSPGRYRSIGTLSNNLIFRKAFNCPEGPMNRGENSCALWGK